MALTCLPVSPMLTSGLRPQVVMGVDAKGEREREKRKEKRGKRKEKRKVWMPCRKLLSLCLQNQKTRGISTKKKKGAEKKGKIEIAATDAPKVKTDASEASTARCCRFFHTLHATQILPSHESRHCLYSV